VSACRMVGRPHAPPGCSSTDVGASSSANRNTARG
jgi:hypothetical protein